MSQENIQFTETIPDIWRVGFMGFLIGLEQLIQNGFAVAVAGVKGMSFDIEYSDAPEPGVRRMRATIPVVQRQYCGP